MSPRSVANRVKWVASSDVSFDWLGFGRGQAGTDECTGAGQRFDALVEDAGKALEDVWHTGSDFEADGEVGGRGVRGESCGVVEQDFVRPGLNQQRREAVKVGEQRTDQRGAPITIADIVVDTPTQGSLTQNGIDGGLGCHAETAERQVGPR